MCTHKDIDTQKHTHTHARTQKTAQTHIHTYTPLRLTHTCVRALTHTHTHTLSLSLTHTHTHKHTHTHTTPRTKCPTRHKIYEQAQEQTERSQVIISGGLIILFSYDPQTGDNKTFTREVRYRVSRQDLKADNNNDLPLSCEHVTAILYVGKRRRITYQDHQTRQRTITAHTC